MVYNKIHSGVYFVVHHSKNVCWFYPFSGVVHMYQLISANEIAAFKLEKRINWKHDLCTL